MTTQNSLHSPMQFSIVPKDTKCTELEIEPLSDQCVHDHTPHKMQLPQYSGPEINRCYYTVIYLLSYNRDQI